MADENPADARDTAGPDGEDESSLPLLSSHDPLPPPPQVTYTRPTLGRAAPPPADSRRPGGPGGGSGGNGFTNLGAGMAAATTFVASVIAGVLIGQWVDHHWGRSGGTPWGTLIFSLLGVAAGFLNLFRVLAATDRSQKK